MGFGFLLMNDFVDFFTVDRNCFWCGDTEANLITSDIYDSNFNIFTDDY